MVPTVIICPPVCSRLRVGYIRYFIPYVEPYVRLQYTQMHTTAEDIRHTPKLISYTAAAAVVVYLVLCLSRYSVEAVPEGRTVEAP
jgi:hypothetical protein